MTDRKKYHSQLQKIYKIIPKKIANYFFVSLFINILIATLSLFFFSRIQPQFPLLYSLSEETKHLVHKNWFFTFFILSFIFHWFNFITIKLIINLHSTIIKLFSWLTLMLQIVLLILLIRTIWIII